MKTTPLAEALATWAADLEPREADRQLAQRALVDTVAVSLAAHEDPLRGLTDSLSEAGRWAVLAHALDFDDLHMGSTSHISAICVPAALASGGDARAYLAAAGVMARIGAALGWNHYTSGWHATCTTGAPAAAVAAGIAFGLTPAQLATAIVLAVPAAGGVQRAFGTHAKSLQVGFAAEAGLRAARLAQAGATADLTALEQWIRLVGGDPADVVIGGPTVPGGLAIKLAPCCYAMQRPIHAARRLRQRGIKPARIASLTVRTPASTVVPLIHHRPRTGLEAKFSLEYAVAAALLDPFPGIDSFTDDAVARVEAVRLVESVVLDAFDQGEGLLAGELELVAHLTSGVVVRTTTTLPPGSPDRPPSSAEFRAKLQACRPDLAEDLALLDWCSAPGLMRRHLPAAARHHRAQPVAV